MTFEDTLRASLHALAETDSRAGRPAPVPNALARAASLRRRRRDAGMSLVVAAAAAGIVAAPPRRAALPPAGHPIERPVTVECRDSGVHLSAATVRARPDGVALRLRNARSQPVNLALPQAGTRLAAGETIDDVAPLPPGKVAIECVADGQPGTTATLVVSDPENLYVDPILDCDGATRIASDAPGARIEHGDPVALTARRISQHSRPHLQLDTVGYPEATTRTVRARRDGRAIALHHWNHITGDSWTYAGALACQPGPTAQSATPHP